MSRFLSTLAFLLLVGLSIAAQDAPVDVAPKPETSTAPYHRGDQAISLGASASIPLAILGGTQSGKLGLGAGFDFSYHYFLDHSWAVGGSVAGDFNGTPAGYSYFAAPLAATISYWKAFAPLEAFAELGLGAYLSRLDGKGMLGPFASASAALMVQTGSGWSIGLKLSGRVLPEIHAAPYADLTRTAIFLDTGLIALYHL